MIGAARQRGDRPTLLDRLRLATSDAHDRVERDLDWQRRVATLPGYRSLLERWWGFHSAVEPQLELAFSRAGDGSFFSPRRKLPLLRRDLIHLGLSERDIDALPVSPWAGPTPGLPGALGTLYVVEGSTLGGQIVARHLRTTLELDPGQDGCSFYAPYGSDVGAMWRETCHRLESASEFGLSDITVEAATVTFERVHAWLVSEPKPNGSRVEAA